MFGGAAAAPAAGGMFGGAAPAAGGMFGGAAAAPAAGGMFGGAAAAPAAGGMFGGAAPAAGGMFGGAAAAPAAGGLFGGAAAAPAAGGGLFGGAAPAAGGGLFGGAAPAAGGGLFGGGGGTIVAPAQAGMGNLFGAAPLGGGTLGAPQMNGLVGAGQMSQAVMAPPPPVIAYTPPTSPPKIAVPPRPVYRHTARSTAKVQTRRWARPDQEGNETNSIQHKNIHNQQPPVVIPMVSIKDPNMFASVVSADADQLSIDAQRNRSGRMDSRLVAVTSPEGMVPSTPLDNTSNHQTPVVKDKPDNSVRFNTPATPQQQDGQHESTPQKASPVKTPTSDFNIRARDTPEGEIRKVELHELTSLSPNHTLLVHDIYIYNAHGSIEFKGPTDLAKVNINKAIRCGHLRLDLYPDVPDDEIPPEGEGFNKPATVKLFNVQPRINDKRMVPEKFERMLKKSLSGEKSGHISYQEETVPTGAKDYVWTFWTKRV